MDGKDFTDTSAVALFVQPLEFAAVVYVIVTVPNILPITIPVFETIAIEVSELLQVPPIVALLRVVVLPLQTMVFPVIGFTVGSAYTNTLLLDDNLLQPVLVFFILTL